MNSHVSPHDKEAIARAFIVEPRHDLETFKRYIRTYPAADDDLRDIMATLILNRAAMIIRFSETSSSNTKQTIEGAVESAWTEFTGAGLPKSGS